MKLLTALLLSIGLIGTSLATEPAKPASAPETKKVCVDKVKDGKPVLGKDGKPQQDCKKSSNIKSLKVPK